MSEALRKAARELLEQMETIFGDDSAWQKELNALRAALAAPEPAEPTQEQAFAVWAERFGLSPEDPGAGIACVAHANGYAAGRASKEPTG